MEMVGIMQSVPVIRSPQNTNFFTTIAASIRLFEAIGTIPQLIRTAARCTVLYSIRNGATAQTASRKSTTSMSRDIILLNCLFQGNILFYLILDCNIQYLCLEVAQGDETNRIACAQIVTYA